MSNKTEKITIRINERLKAKYKRLCELRDTTMSSDIEDHIKNTVSNHTDKEEL